MDASRKIADLQYDQIIELQTNHAKISEGFFMTEKHIGLLNSGALNSIHPHGTSHVAFSNMNSAQTEQELQASRDWIKGLAGIPEIFCAPYGQKRDLGDLNRLQVFNADSWLATTTPGFVTQSQKINRINIHGADTKSSFKLKMTGVTAAFGFRC